MSTILPANRAGASARTPVPAAPSRAAAPLDALEACLCDEAGLLGDASRVADGLRRRREGLLHVVGLTGSLGGATARALRDRTQDAGAFVLNDAGGQAHHIELSWMPADREAGLHDLTLHVVDAPVTEQDEPGTAAPDVPAAARLRLDAQGEFVLEGPLLAGRAPLERGLEALLSHTAYGARHRSRTAEIALGIVASLQLHAQWLQRAHAARRETLGRLLSRSGASTPDRSTADALRAELTDALQTLDRSLRERCRRTLASEGGVQARMVAEIAKICDTDLAREPARQAVNVSLRRELVIDLQRAMREHVEHDLHSMVEEGNVALADLDALVERSLRGGSGAGALGSLPRWQVAGFIDRVADAMQFNVRYHGTLPRRGFLHRLAEGRKSIFTVLMFTSLLGSFLGFNWRTHPALGGLFMIGFLVAVAWTYRSWQDEDRERLDDELEKAREQLRMEARRLLGDVYRELQAAWAEAIEGARRAGLGLVDDATRAAAARGLRDGQALRDAAQAALRQIEARETPLTTWRQRLARSEAELIALRGREVP